MVKFKACLTREPVLVAVLLPFRFCKSVVSPAGHKIDLLLVPRLIDIHVEHGGAKNDTTWPQTATACRIKMIANLEQGGIRGIKLMGSWANSTRVNWHVQSSIQETRNHFPRSCPWNFEDESACFSSLTWGHPVRSQKKLPPGQLWRPF